MARPKSIREIQTEILENMNIGIDRENGSLASAGAGAVAVQIATLLQAERLAQHHNDPLWCDANSLELLGRMTGVFPIKATTAIIEMQVTDDVPPVLHVNDVVQITENQRQYRVTTEVRANNTYYLESVARGRKDNAIASDWYVEVQFTQLGQERKAFKGKVLQILSPARDDDTPDQFRARVYNARMTRPFNANPQFFREYLTREFAGGGRVEVVRVQLMQYLTDSSHATLNIYLGGENLTPVSDYVKNLADSALQETLPIGMTYLIAPVVRLDQKNGERGLFFDITYSQINSNYPVLDLAKKEVVNMLQDYLISTTISTPPTKRIMIDISVLQGRIANMLASYTNGTVLRVTYKNAQFSTKLYLDYEHTPWATDKTVEIHPADAPAMNPNPDP